MISVCIATYNGSLYIKEQLDSILSQIGESDEVIISDDFSTDTTLSIIKSIHDDRIILLNNSFGRGVNYNFENALKHANGNYIFLSDQDDIWLPGKVNNCIRALKDADCVVHDAIVVDSNLNVLEESFFKSRNSGNGFMKNIYKNTYLGCCMAFRREMIEYILPIPKTKAFFHDNWIGGIIELRGKVVFIPFKGIMFRRHSSNTSSTAKESNIPPFRQITNRICQLTYTISRILSSSLIPSLKRKSNAQS